MGGLCELDAVNYLWYASWYLKRFILFTSIFASDVFVVKYRACAVLAVVAGDMRLEELHNRFARGPRGHVIVGSSSNAVVVAEFGLLFHEILAIIHLALNTP